MNENTKIKYIIGSYVDDDNYPTIEDVEFLIRNYCNVNKTKYIHDTKIASLINKDDATEIITELENNNFLSFDKELKEKKKYKVLI